MIMDCISVIVPIYNVEQYLHKCVDSILNQTYKELEIILVNDGSPDGCLRICNEYAVKDSRIKVLDKVNGGLSDARNAGIDIAKGEYLLFVDSDDYIHNTMIEELYTSMQYNNSDIAICDLVIVDEDGNEISKKENIIESGIFSQQEYWNAEEKNQFNGWYGVSWNKLYKRKIFDDLRFEKGKIHEDVFIYYKIISECDAISVVDKKLYYYLKRGNSIMGEKISFRRIDLVEAFIERGVFSFENHREELAKTNFTNAMNQLKLIYEEVPMSCEELNKFNSFRVIIIKYNKVLLKNNFLNMYFFRGILFLMSMKMYVILLNMFKRKK